MCGRVLGDALLFLFGVLCLAKPEWLIGAVYPPARVRRLRWLEIMLVLTGIYCALVGLVRLIT
jgi:hypothetical protein